VDTTPAGSDLPVASRPTVEDQKLARELAEREKELKKREADMASRERELAEQRRVLAEQYRLLKARPQHPQPAVAAAAGVSHTTAAWPPAAPAGSRPRVQGPNFAMYQPKRRAGFWRRFKNTLLGTPEPVLEDSL
jgi:hypothetical protein